MSLKLSLKFKVEFVKMMNLHLRRNVQKEVYEQKDLRVIKKLLGIVFFFLSSI